MAFRRLMFIFLISFFYVNCEVITENTPNSTESYSAEISAVLNYLNSTPVKVYNYKQGILLNAHKKADITELTLDVNVDCVNNYPDLPCTEKVLICNAFVRKNAEGGIQVLNDVNCKPKPEIIVDEPYVPSPTNATEVDANETKSIALSNEAVSSEVGEHFVAVRRDSVPCLGCPFDLNPNVEGVDELVNLALNHIQGERKSKQNAVKVLRLQQQVVNGVKYILLVEVAPKVDCSLDPVFSEGPCPVDPKQITVCQVTFIHKPWISKSKHIINNNCTVSQEFVLPDPKDNDVINEIDSNRRTKPAFVDGPNFDHMAETGAIDEMTPSRLEDLESQIMVELEDPVTKKPKANILELRIIDEIIVPSTAESEISANPVVSAQNEEVQNQRNSNDEEGDSSQSPVVESVDPTPFTSGHQIIINKCNAQDDVETQTVESTSEKPSSSEENKESKESAENRAERSIDSAGSNEAIEEITDSPSGDVNESSEEILKDSSEEKGSGRTKRAIPQLEKISPEEKGLVKNLADYVATALDDVDDDNHKRMVLQILGAKKMAGDNGVYYHMILRMGISHCLEDTTPNPNENCREKLFENYTKICKVQVHVKKDDFVSPKIVKSQCQNNKKDKNESNRTNYSRFKRNVVVGGLNEIDKDSPKVQKFVKEGVRHLDSQLNHSTKLKPMEVLSASSQVVAGISYRIKTKIGLSDCSKDDQRDLDECNLLEGSEPKVCEIRVWEKAWLNFRQISIKCDDDDKVYKFESNKEERFKRQLGGQIFEVSKNDESVQEYLEHALKHMDSESSHENKLKVQEILSAANQIVSGTLHRIKAKIVLSDCKKTDSKERAQCGILEGAKPKICNFKIWNQVWLPNGRETNITCDDETHSFRSKREVIPGGQFEVSKDDETVKKYLEHSLKHMDSESSHENKLKIHEILNVTNQVVSGTLHRIKAKVVLSDCKKTDSKERTECGVLEGAKPKVCNFKIWDQPWLPNGRETNITCDDETHSFRSKRDIETHQIRGLLGHNDTAVHFAMFNEFIKTFKKTYSKKEYKYRLKVFSDNMKHVRVLNTYEQGTATYGVTQFADMTPKEFSKSLGLRMDLRNENAVPFSKAETPNIEIPTEFDWRKHGAVTEVKNQEQCGSCWAFSVTGNIEGQYAIKHERLLEFSEQELVDCDTEDQGCNGGLMDNAYRAIEKMGGLETEQDYPYDAEDEKCHFNRSLARVQLTGAVNISHNETNMAKWLVANGPISIAINANAMQFYMGGISHPFRFLCNPNNLDHGVLIVGYGVHTYPLFNKTLPYWIVKNSWGTSWGEQGYYRVYRGDGTCGLNQTPSSAIVA